MDDWSKREGVYVEKCMNKACLVIPMVRKDTQIDKEDISASGLSPFKSSLYRMLWIEENLPQSSSSLPIP